MGSVEGKVPKHFNQSTVWSQGKANPDNNQNNNNNNNNNNSFQPYGSDQVCFFSELLNQDKKEAGLQGIEESQDSHGQKFESFKVHSVYKITAPVAKEKYTKQREQIRSEMEKRKTRNGERECELLYPAVTLNRPNSLYLEKLLGSIDHDVNECFLFHCPNQTNFAEEIRNSNVDEHYSNGGLAGKAIYFAERPTKCDEYARRLSSHYQNLINEGKKEEAYQEVYKKIEKHCPYLIGVSEKFEQLDKERESAKTRESDERKEPGTFWSEKQEKEFNQIWELRKEKTLKATRMMNINDDDSRVREDCKKYCMILSRVTMGHTYLSNFPKREPISGDTPHPPVYEHGERYHSVLINCQRYMGNFDPNKYRLKNYREFVIYSNEQVCPELVIEYSRVGQPKIDLNNNNTKINTSAQYLAPTVDNIAPQTSPTWLVVIFFVKTENPGLSCKNVDKYTSLEMIREGIYKRKKAHSLFPIWVFDKKADERYAKAKGADANPLDHFLFYIYIDATGEIDQLAVIESVFLHSTLIKTNEQIISLMREEFRDVEVVKEKNGLLDNSYHSNTWPSFIPKNSHLKTELKPLRQDNMAFFSCKNNVLPTLIDHSMKTLIKCRDPRKATFARSSIINFSNEDLSLALSEKGVDQQTLAILKREEIDGPTFLEITEQDMKDIGLSLKKRVTLRKILSEVPPEEKTTAYIRIDAPDPFSFIPYLKKEDINVDELLPASLIYKVTLSASQLGRLALALQFDWADDLRRDKIEILDIWDLSTLLKHWENVLPHYNLKNIEEREKKKAIDRFISKLWGNESVSPIVDLYQIQTAIAHKQMLKTPTFFEIQGRLMHDLLPFIQFGTSRAVLQDYKRKYPEYKWEEIEEILDTVGSRAEIATLPHYPQEIKAKQHDKSKMRAKNFYQKGIKLEKTNIIDDNFDVPTSVPYIYFKYCRKTKTTLRAFHKYHHYPDFYLQLLAGESISNPIPIQILPEDDLNQNFCDFLKSVLNAKKIYFCLKNAPWVNFKGRTLSEVKNFKEKHFLYSEDKDFLSEQIESLMKHFAVCAFVFPKFELSSGWSQAKKISGKFGERDATFVTIHERDFLAIQALPNNTEKNVDRVFRDVINVPQDQKKPNQILQFIIAENPKLNEKEIRVCPDYSNTLKRISLFDQYEIIGEKGNPQDAISVSFSPKHDFDSEAIIDIPIYITEQLVPGNAEILKTVWYLYTFTKDDFEKMFINPIEALEIKDVGNLKSVVFQIESPISFFWRIKISETNLRNLFLNEFLHVWTIEELIDYCVTRCLDSPVAIDTAIKMAESHILNQDAIKQLNILRQKTPLHGHEKSQIFKLYNSWKEGDSQPNQGFPDSQDTVCARIKFQQFFLVYHQYSSGGIPMLAIAHVNAKSGFNQGSISKEWENDTRAFGNAWYKNDQYDRGYMVTRKLLDCQEWKKDRQEIVQETDTYLNIAPHHTNFHNEEWKLVETYIYRFLRRNELEAIVCTGAWFDNASNQTDTKKGDPTKTRRVPDAYYKIVVYYDEKEKKLDHFCFWVPHTQQTSRKSLKDLIDQDQKDKLFCDLTKIQAAIGMDFDFTLH